MAGPVLWFRPESLADLQDGDPVAIWPDSSGNGYDAIQDLVPDGRPTYLSGALNGHAVVHFDGLDDSLGILGTEVLNDISIFAVYELESGAVAHSYYPVLLGGTPNVGGTYYGIETRNGSSGNSPNVLDVITEFSNDARATLTGISEFDQWRVISAVTDTGIQFTTVRANGVDAAMGSTGVNSGLNVPVGNATGTGWGGLGGSLYAGGTVPHLARVNIAEVIVYGTPLTGQDRLDVEDYLSLKYGL